MLTEQGKKTYELVFSYNLGGFYNEYMGNIIIEPSKLTVDVMNDLLKFLSENTDWVMGYEDIGDGRQNVFVTQADLL